VLCVSFLAAETHEDDDRLVCSTLFVRFSLCGVKSFSCEKASFVVTGGVLLRYLVDEVFLFRPTATGCIAILYEARPLSFLLELPAALLAGTVTCCWNWLCLVALRAAEPTLL